MWNAPLWDARWLLWIVNVATVIALIVCGVVADRTLLAPRPLGPVDFFAPALGETDAVLSIQFGLDSHEDPNEDPHQDGDKDGGGTGGARDADGRHRCTATLIRKKWAVTAARGVTAPPAQVYEALAEYCGTEPVPESKRVSPESTTLTVRGGAKRFDRGETATVVRVHIAPGWRTSERDTDGAAHDLALLQLDHPMSIDPIPVASTTPPRNAWSLVTGWSTPGDGCGEANLFMELWALRLTDCPDETGGKEICATTGGAEGPCAGTSGGPLFAMDNGEPPSSSESTPTTSASTAARTPARSLP